MPSRRTARRSGDPGATAPPSAAVQERRAKAEAKRARRRAKALAAVAAGGAKAAP